MKQYIIVSNNDYLPDVGLLDVAIYDDEAQPRLGSYVVYDSGNGLVLGVVTTVEADGLSFELDNGQTLCNSELSGAVVEIRKPIQTQNAILPAVAGWLNRFHITKRNQQDFQMLWEGFQREVDSMLNNMD